MCYRFDICTFFVCWHENPDMFAPLQGIGHIFFSIIFFIVYIFVTTCSNRSIHFVLNMSILSRRKIECGNLETVADCFPLPTAQFHNLPLARHLLCCHFPPSTFPSSSPPSRCPLAVHPKKILNNNFSKCLWGILKSRRTLNQITSSLRRCPETRPPVAVDGLDHSVHPWSAEPGPIIKLALGLLSSSVLCCFLS